MKKILSIIIFLQFIQLPSQVKRMDLHSNWKFTESQKSDWKSATVPGNIHTDLFNNQIIPHPFEGENEKDLQWISENNWTYQTEFELTKEQLNYENIDLVLEGLDTYAKVYLNDKLILDVENAFRIYKADVKKQLKKKNTLRIEFTNPNSIEEIKAQKNPYKLPEGNRIFTRKAQFQYGWDWGPKYNTMGIWRPVYLEFWNDVKIEDVFINQHNLTKNTARIIYEINLKSNRKKNFIIEHFLNGEKIGSMQIDLKKENYNVYIPLNIDKPKLWWTHNLGDPYLYEFKVQMRDLKGNLLDEKIIKKGLRTIELVTEKDEFGESFYFKLNGEPVFMKGANYIPQNSFQNWVTKDHYDKLLNDAKRANMNMLRVWGGGIYEEDYFYEKCDELGILVWQDFMFACAMYPGDEEFLENVKQEAIDNVKRLRNYASLALWCGNNESNEGWHRWGWQDGRTEKEKQEIWADYQNLFNGILPKIVEEYTDIPYWESSPKFGRGDARYISEGDAHDWWIWHDGHPFENLETKTPRFMSEFGFQGLPSWETMQFMQGKEEIDFNSPEFKNHQKHRTGFETIKTYMERDFPVPTNEKDYAYVSQLVQAYGIGKGIEAQRRNKPRTMGSLYWQLNDVWPAVSWSSIDYFGNWKAMHYQAKKSFQDVLISFERKDNLVDVFIVNDSFFNQFGKFKITLADFDGNILEQIEKEIEVDSNSSSAVHTLDISNHLHRENEIYLHSEFKSYENIFYFVSPKEMKFKESPIKISLFDTADGSGYIIYLTSNSLQKFVEVKLNAEGEFSSNYFDILPHKSYFLFFKTKELWPYGEKLIFKTLNSLNSQK